MIPIDKAITFLIVLFFSEMRTANEINTHVFAFDEGEHVLISFRFDDGVCLGKINRNFPL